MKFLFFDFLFFILILIFSQSVICEDNIEEFTDSCINNTLCENSTTTEISEFDGNNEDEDVNIRELATNLFKPSKPNNTKVSIINTTPKNVDKELKRKSGLEPSQVQKAFEQRSKMTYCSCDMTATECDINCCCDLDCTENHFKVFSYCIENEIDKEKETWYCTEKPFFKQNDTRFILQKVLDSLFCVATDNLPPIYSATSHLQIEDQESFKNAIKNNKPSKFKWALDTKKLNLQEFNASNFYRYGDILWKITRNSFYAFEIPQAGFGKACEFKKTIKFLEDWKSACHQTNLNNKNPFLFASNLSNITFAAIPSKLILHYSSQDCPKHLCRSVNFSICSDSWTLCKPKLVLGYCTESTCYNVAKRIRYTIFHNGSDGIKSIEAQFQLANVSHTFIQEFEIRYKWFGLNQSLIFERSGNPGYVEGKPIFIGTLTTNKSEDAQSEHIAVNKTHQHLSLPVADKTGLCNQEERYPIKFLEDVKLKCSIVVKSNNFSSTTCIKLQNLTYNSMISFMAQKKFAKFDFDKQYVSRFGNISDNSTDSWTKIFFEKIPQNVISSQILENEIQCSGLVTTVAVDIVHSLVTKPGADKNHVVLGVGMTFSQELDLKWPKCGSKNCLDVLKLDLLAFASFHDVSRPTRYHIAGGPNLDISLPYDFFYPFLKHSKEKKKRQKD